MNEYVNSLLKQDAPPYDEVEELLNKIDRAEEQHEKA